MYIQIVHTNGKRYKIPVLQVLVTDNNDLPLAIAYENSDLIIYTDATKNDFQASLHQLHLKPSQVSVYDV